MPTAVRGPSGAAIPGLTSKDEPHLPASPAAPARATSPQHPSHSHNRRTGPRHLAPAEPVTHHGEAGMDAGGPACAIVESADSAVAVTPRHIAAARRELGALLAQCREAAGLRQEDLARRTHYARSTIAGVETGRQATPRAFWERADAAVGAGGVLVKAFNQIEQLAEQARHQRRLARRRARYATLLAELKRYSDLAPGYCPCGRPLPVPVVAAWTGQHVRALRRATQLTIAQLADQLGVTSSTLAAWQRRHQPLPLAAQRRLDIWLATADPTIQLRFWATIQDQHPPTAETP